jgi:hypothetical protein
VTVLTQAPQSGRDSVRDASNLAIGQSTGMCGEPLARLMLSGPSIHPLRRWTSKLEVDVIGYLRPVFGVGTPKQDDKPSSHASSMGEHVVEQLCTRAASDATGATVQAGQRPRPPLFADMGGRVGRVRSLQQDHLSPQQLTN